MRLLGRVWMFAIQSFFIGMLVLPTTFQLQRGAILLLLASVACVLAFRFWLVHREILLLWLATMVVGSFGILWGVVNDAPGALRVSTVYFIWPALYMLFVGLPHGLRVMQRLQMALLLGIVIATAMALIVLLAGLLGVGDIVYPVLFFQDAGFGAYDGFMEFRIYNLTTVMYGFPFVMALILVNLGRTGWSGTVGLWLLLVVMMVVALGSGRRMFWLLLLLSPMLALFFLQLSALRLPNIRAIRLIAKLGIMAVAATVGMAVVTDIELGAIADNFISAFAGQEVSSAARIEQAKALWNSFVRAPLIGNGLGSTVHVVRSAEQPWAYELTYFSLLKSVGLLGFLVYAFAIGWVAVKGVLLARRDSTFAAMFVPLVTALVAFLVMSGTNPYLAKFDYLWVIFLPVALLNSYLTQSANYA